MFSLSRAALLAALLAALPAFGQSKTDQDKKTDKAQIIGTAEITKIDAKKLPAAPACSARCEVSIGPNQLLTVKDQAAFPVIPDHRSS